MPLCKQVVPETAQSCTCYPGCSLSRQTIAKRAEYSTTPTPLCQQVVPEGRGDSHALQGQESAPMQHFVTLERFCCLSCFSTNKTAQQREKLRLDAVCSSEISHLSLRLRCRCLSLPILEVSAHEIGVGLLERFLPLLALLFRQHLVAKGSL
jgi:hypothetical protein